MRQRGTVGPGKDHKDLCTKGVFPETYQDRIAAARAIRDVASAYHGRFGDNRNHNPSIAVNEGYAELLDAAERGAPVDQIKNMMMKAMADRDAASQDPGRVCTGVEMAERIERCVCERMGVKPAHVRGKSKVERICCARELIWYLCRKWADMSTPEIGKWHDRGHSTIIEGSQRWCEKCEKQEPMILIAGELVEPLKVQQESERDMHLTVVEYGQDAVRWLGLDVGRLTGWAVSRNHDIPYGGTATMKKPNQNNGHAVTALKLFVAGKIADHKITRVVYEKVRRHEGTDAAHAYGAYESALMEVCNYADVPLHPVTVQSIKLAATDKGNASKASVVSAAKAKWPGFEGDDNEADARFALVAAMQVE